MSIDKILKVSLYWLNMDLKMWMRAKNEKTSLNL